MDSCVQPERRNLVSAHVPSYFIWPPLVLGNDDINANLPKNSKFPLHANKNIERLTCVCHTVAREVCSSTIRTAHCCDSKAAFQYSLHCWQQYVCVDDTNGKHCCISLATMSKRTRYNPHCLPYRNYVSFVRQSQINSAHGVPRFFGTAVNWNYTLFLCSSFLSAGSDSSVGV